MDEKPYLSKAKLFDMARRADHMSVNSSSKMDDSNGNDGMTEGAPSIKSYNSRVRGYDEQVRRKKTQSKRKRANKDKKEYYESVQSELSYQDGGSPITKGVPSHNR